MFDDISFCMYWCEFVCVIGLFGCGKLMLIWIFVGFDM